MFLVSNENFCWRCLQFKKNQIKILAFWLNTNIVIFFWEELNYKFDFYDRYINASKEACMEVKYYLRKNDYHS